MLRVISVDDELSNHILLKKSLEEDGLVQVVAQFSDPLTLLEKVVDIHPDVAFVDIEMPVMNGLELAERILFLCPNTQIVFVTAFSQYAVNAFHVNAIDYLLKPIDGQDIKRVIQKLLNNRKLVRAAALNQDIDLSEVCRINTLGSFDVYGIQSKQPIQWLTSKVEELFAYLLLHSGKSVGKEELCDVLWPDSDHENGMMNLYSTIYRLRKTLAKETIPIEITSGKYGYQINTESCFLDFKVFEKLTSSLETQQSAGESDSDIANMVEAALVYKGEFFGIRSYLWSAAYGESINQTYRLLNYRLVNHFLKLKRMDKAVEYLKRILQFFPDEEQACILLMTLYSEEGETKSVSHCYHTYVTYLEDELSVTPSSKIQERYKDLLK
jgi:two-component SAPR family response regulator